MPAELPAGIADAFSYADAIRTDEHPSMWYRRKADGAGEPRFVRDDPLRDERSIPVGTSVQQLVDDLHLSVALHADDVFVHAGVVAWQGAAILVPGRSHTGKSTLVEALVRAGATYCSDEYARVTAEGSIAPYARPIQLRSDSGRRTVDATTIGAVAHHPLPPSLVLFTRFVSGASFDPEPVLPAAAALELYDNTVVAEVRPDDATSAAAHIARTATAVRTERPNAEEVAAAVLELATR